MVRKSNLIIVQYSGHRGRRATGKLGDKTDPFFLAALVGCTAQPQCPREDGLAEDHVRYRVQGVGILGSIGAALGYCRAPPLPRVDALFPAMLETPL